MTHKRFQFAAMVCDFKADRYRGIGKAYVTAPLTEDSVSIFKLGEKLSSKLFNEFEYGDKLLVQARVNMASSSKRRYLLSCRQLTGEEYKEYLEKSVEATAAAYDAVTIDDLLGAVAEATEKAEAAAATTEQPKVEDPNDKMDFYISAKHVEIFNNATMMLEQRPQDPVRVLMLGKAGYGKTSLAKTYAKHRGMEYYRQDCASVRDTEEWFGWREARGGDTVFLKSEMMQVIERGNAVILLDEFNRVEPHLHNSIYHLLEPDAKPIIHGEEFSIGHNIVFVMTINVGYKHSGTFTLDDALISRADMFCEVGQLPPLIEAKVLNGKWDIGIHTANDIVKAAAAVRALDMLECSTRTTLQIARNVSAGMPVRSAFEHTVVNRCKADILTADYTKPIIDAINTAIGTYSRPRSTTLL